MITTRISASERRWKPEEVVDEYVLVGKTISNSSTWAFDRLRMYCNSTTALVQLRWPDGTIIDTQPFHTGGGWTEGVAGSFEHDFLFDLSANTANEELLIMMKGLCEDPTQMTEVYTYPTGFTASRGKNAQITYWDLSYFNTLNNGSTHGYFLSRDNPLHTLLGAELAGAINMNFENCNLDGPTLDKLMIALDSTGYTGGTYNWTNNAGSPSSAVKANYDSLAAKSWTLEGIPPPSPVPTGQSYYMLNETNGNTYADAGPVNNTATKRGGSHSTDGKLLNGYQGATAAGNDIQVPYVADYNILAGDNTMKPHSISFWFKTTNNALTWQMLAGRSGMFYCALYNGTLRWVILGGSEGNLERRSYQFTFNNNTWYCVTLSYEGGGTLADLKMYINGAHVDRSSTVGSTLGTISANSNPFVFCNHYNGSNAFGLNGVIDEIAIDVGTAWTESEHAGYYNNGQGIQRTVANNSYTAINDLTIDRIHSTGAKVSFTPPTSDHPINSYEISIGAQLNNTFTDPAKAWVKGLTAGTQYSSIRVTAIDIYGNRNDVSNSISFTTASNAVFPTTSLAGYYTMDSDFTDSVGTNHGTNYGATQNAGKINNGFAYDGNDDYTIIPTPYYSGNPSWTLSAWLHIPSASATRSGVLVIRPQNTGGMHVLLYNDGRLLIGRWNGGSTFVTPPLNSWFHLAITYNSSTRLLTIYIDGVVTATLTQTSSQLYAFNGDIIIGDGVTSELNYLGSIDELALYTDDLLEPEIKDITNNGSGNQYS